MTIAGNGLLELHYLPCIQYFTKFYLHSRVWIEQHEHYQKGSYRNRAHIASANGLLRLSIPLVKGKHQQQNIREVRIAYDEPWPTQHWQSIRSAYGNAPFFEYYSEHLQPIFHKRPTFLFDFNLELLQTLLGLLSIDCPVTLSTEYYKNIPDDWKDYRNLISPKNEQSPADPFFKGVKYVQVFEEKHGFLPNLSILDLLFCVGPGASMLLEASIPEN